jgi:dihydrofolate reductase
MGRLIATTQATVDGVIDPVGPWVEEGGDHSEYSFERQARSSGLVLGRPTYEGLAAYWPSQSGKWADMVNAIPKYVGSRTLSGPLEWNATLLEGDVEDSIPKLKDEVDDDLFMHGSGEFAYALAEKGLIDEYEIYFNPLVWGKGNVHVLGDRGTVRLELDDVKRFDSGVVLLTYRPG